MHLTNIKTATFEGVISHVVPSEVLDWAILPKSIAQSRKQNEHMAQVPEVKHGLIRMILRSEAT